MKHALGPRSAILILLTMAGCTFSPRPFAGKLTCSTAADHCPGDMVCMSGVCQNRLGDATILPDAAADAVIDAASPDKPAPADTQAPPDMPAETVANIDAAGDRDGSVNDAKDAGDAPPEGPPCPWVLTPGVDLSTGLVALLPLDDGGRNPVVADESRNQITAMVNNLDTGASWVPGRMGSGLSLNGGASGAWIELGGTPLSTVLNNIIDGFSFSLWAKFPKGTPPDGVLISRRSAGALGFLYRVSVSGGRLRAQLHTSNGNHADVLANQTLLTDGGWMHLGGAYGDNGQGLEIFVNGGSVGKDPLFALQLGAENTPVLFGGAENPTAPAPSTTIIDRLHGALDDVAIYSRALPPSAFKSLSCGVRP